MQNRSRNFQPESSVPYSSFICRSNEVQDINQNEIYLKLGVLSQCKGSAYMEFGQTKVVCVVFPPQEPTKQTIKTINVNSGSVLECEFSIPQFATRETSQNRIRKQKSLALALKKALEPVIYRQDIMSFKIGIFVLVLEDRGSLFSTALNCCGAALAEGGIPVYNVFAASTFIKDISSQFQQSSTQGDKIYNEITAFSKCSTSKQVAECFQKGYISIESFKEELNKTLSKNESILTLVHKILLDRAKSVTLNKD